MQKTEEMDRLETRTNTEKTEVDVPICFGKLNNPEGPCILCSGYDPSIFCYSSSSVFFEQLEQQRYTHHPPSNLKTKSAPIRATQAA